MSGAGAPAVLVTRPEPDSAALAGVLSVAGWRAVRAPMLAINRIDRARSSDLAACSAVVFTSRHGVALATADLPELRGRGAPTVYAVGARTAEAARAAGLAHVVEGPGAAAGLLERLRRDRPARVLVCQARDVACDLAGSLRAQGLNVAVRALYAADPLTLTPHARSEIVSGAIAAALFFSGRTTETFLNATAGLDLAGVAAICNSERTAAPARASGVFAAIRVAEAPTTASVLKALGPPPRQTRR